MAGKLDHGNYEALTPEMVLAALPFVTARLAQTAENAQTGQSASILYGRVLSAARLVRELHSQYADNLEILTRDVADYRLLVAQVMREEAGAS